MKSEEEITRAASLLSLALTGQVALDPPWTPEAAQQALAVCRALQWVLDLPEVEPMDQLLARIERACDGPGFNPRGSFVE